MPVKRCVGKYVGNPWFFVCLYFVFAVDTQESDLGILDLIQVFVEALDKCFENVCELDLIFHSDKVMYVLDEIIMAGMVLETNIVNILQAVQDQNKLHSKSIKVISLPSSTSTTATAIALAGSTVAVHLQNCRNSSRNRIRTIL